MLAAASTVIVTIAALLVWVPSLAWYRKLSTPVKPVFGVYVSDPSGFRTSGPWRGPSFATTVAVNVPVPRSLASTGSVREPAVVMLYASFRATGDSLPTSTVMVTVASGLYSTPSNTEYLNVKTPSPATPGAGT